MIALQGIDIYVVFCLVAIPSFIKIGATYDAIAVLVTFACSQAPKLFAGGLSKLVPTGKFPVPLKALIKFVYWEAERVILFPEPKEITVPVFTFPL